MTRIKYVVSTFVLILCSLASSEGQNSTRAIVESSDKVVTAVAPQLGVPVNLTGASDGAIVTVTNTGAATGGGVGVSGEARAGYGVQGSGLIGVKGLGGATGIGVQGVVSGSGDGILGQSGANGNGVKGVGGYGVYGESSTAVGVYGRGTSTLSSGVQGVNNSGGLAGFFDGPVQINGKLTVTQGCTGCSPPSDRNLKANFSTVNPRSILTRLASIPIQSWNYKSDAETIRHIGPMAQDFRAAFGLGESDKTLNTVDASGVTMAAIQGLYQLMQEKDRQIEALTRKVEQQQAQLNQVKRTIKRNRAAR